MDLLIEQDFPCWYELSWREEYAALVVRVHQDFITGTFGVCPASPIVERLRKEFGITASFAGSLTSNFGFAGGWLQRQEQAKNGFVEYFLPLSSGGGGQYSHTVSVSAATLNVFFKLLNQPIMTSSPQRQLMTIATVNHKGPHGGSLFGVFSPAFVVWLASLYKEDEREDSGTPVPEMSQAMAAADCHIFAEPQRPPHCFPAYIGNSGGGLVATCLGNSCGLNPSNWGSIKEGRGYKLSCHNVDTAGQQLTLLAGLAALHDRARREMNTGAT